MNCEEYFHLISSHLDGCNSETEEKQLQQHLKSCENCRAILAQLQENEQLLSQSTVAPPVDLTKRIMKAVRKEPKKKSKKRFYTSFAAAGLAAAALLALVFFGSNGLPQLATEDAAYMVADGEPYAMEDFTPAENAVEPNASLYYFDDSATGESTLYSAGSATTAPDSEKNHEEQASTPARESPRATDNESWVLTDEFPYGMDVKAYGTTVSGNGVANGMSSIYGIQAADGELRELPTLIIYGAKAEDFPGLRSEFALPKQLPSLQTANMAVDGSFYQRFFSILPPELGLLPGFPEEQSYELSRYSVSYERFIALMNAAVGSYETAVYFPQGMDQTETCLVILISAEETE
ncbi:MAG: zf-HC2 domain-containing protein [Oscillospiraceae bacterium]|nr:zf-HC2 domain-containing protein [Oscillospiraceae bacterium]